MNGDHLSRTLSRHVLLLRYSKVRSPLLRSSLHLNMYFLCTIGTPLAFISFESRVNISSMLSNLSAYSAQSPPIYLQYCSAVRPSGILRLRPGGGKTGRTTLMRIWGVLNLNPDSVLPVKVLNCVIIIIDGLIRVRYWWANSVLAKLFNNIFI